MQSPSKAATLRLEPGHTVLLTGPAEIKLSEGKAACFGAPISQNSWITIEALRQEPVLAYDPCVLEIKPGHGSSWKIVNESTIPVGWSEAAQIVQRQQGLTVIVGEVDSGKSSLCTFIANSCIQNGLTVGVIDGDVGQADIGPPTTVSSARLSEPVWSLQQLKQENTFFVGDTSPSSVPDKLIRSLVYLKEDLADSTDIVIINTDGWIGDSAAIRFKDELLHETRPDLVIGIGGEEIEPLLRVISSSTVKLSSSSHARTRSKEERKSAREAGYRRFLLGSKTVRVGQENTRLGMFDQPEQSILQWDRRFRGFLAGLLGADQRLLGIGRIREMTDGNALVETRAAEQPKFLEIGNLKLSSNYEEIGYGVLH